MFATNLNIQSIFNYNNPDDIAKILVEELNYIINSLLPRKKSNVRISTQSGLIRTL